VASKTELNRLCEKLWGHLIRSIGYCEKCGKRETLQAAHVKPKGKFRGSLKWDLQNGICLCYGCHLHWAHKDPLGFTEWFLGKYPQRYVFLSREARRINKLDYDRTILTLWQEVQKRRITMVLRGKEKKILGDLI
jgi:hypothetical protein